MNICNLLYIYFIYKGKKLIYIGRSKHPLNRIKDHRLNGCLNDVEEYRVVIYGPYRKWTAHIIESYEIIKRSKNKNLLSKTNSNYGYNQKISVKDSGQKTVYFFRERSEVKKMVC